MNNYILKPGQWKGRWRRWIRTFPRLMPETQRLAQMRSLDAWKIWNHKHFVPLLFSSFLLKNPDFEERFDDELECLQFTYTVHCHCVKNSKMNVLVKVSTCWPNMFKPTKVVA